ncbi:hypothetical protein MNV_1690003 [Candidatus Methanoperedens nitroreducens]|uniref:Uncharacterized protein n=1 Tax=Candidatus Methanoperedens nitratireducens TaxID=1392998 RepID=A0A284VLV9_9EURY|nr:hypothetical protein MNV_1690003 [Candidatus Methanoperedens nitroreducens]
MMPPAVEKLIPPKNIKMIKRNFAFSGISPKFMVEKPVPVDALRTWNTVVSISSGYTACTASTPMVEIRTKIQNSFVNAVLNLRWINL